MGKYDCITNWLSNKRYASDIDKKLFEEWRVKKMTTAELKKEFLKNNEFPALSSQIISDDLLVEWLGSIGWRQRSL